MVSACFLSACALALPLQRTRPRSVSLPAADAAALLASQSSARPRALRQHPRPPPPVSGTGPALLVSASSAPAHTSHPDALTPPTASQHAPPQQPLTQQHRGPRIRGRSMRSAPRRDPNSPSSPGRQPRCMRTLHPRHPWSPSSAPQAPTGVIGLLMTVAWLASQHVGPRWPGSSHTTSFCLLSCTEVASPGAEHDWLLVPSY